MVYGGASGLRHIAHLLGKLQSPTFVLMIFCSAVIFLLAPFCKQRGLYYIVRLNHSRSSLCEMMLLGFLPPPLMCFHHTFCSKPWINKIFGTKIISELESFFLADILTERSVCPICNNRSRLCTRSAHMRMGGVSG